MKFYTQVARIGNNICYRGYEDGKRVSYREPFGPTFYLSSKKPSTEWSTLDGKPMDPMTFESMKEATDFVKRYEDVDEIQVMGNTNYAAQYIQKHFPTKIDYDPKLLKIANFDIEVESVVGDMIEILHHPPKAE